jgi:hypothetical protein
MLVFGRLEPRKFQIMKNQKLAKDDATGVVYIPWVCNGAFLSLHTFAGYIHAAWVSLYSLFFISHRGLQTTASRGSDTHVFCMWLYDNKL